MVRIRLGADLARFRFHCNPSYVRSIHPDASSLKSSHDSNNHSVTDPWTTHTFSDESQFLLSRDDGRTRVYKMLRGALYSKLHATNRPFWWWQHHGVPGIYHGGRTALVHLARALTGIRCPDKILQHQEGRKCFI